MVAGGSVILQNKPVGKYFDVSRRGMAMPL
jgi:hypothetical protein